MKVLMQGKIDLFENSGGDRIQIQNTAKELRKLGVEIDIIPKFDVEHSKYDLVHIFQLDWIPEPSLMAVNAKKAGLPVVFSPIHHRVAELEKFEDEYAFGLRRLSKVVLKNQYKKDTSKNIYRAFFDKRKIIPTLKSMIYGLKKIQRRALESTDVVLVQTEQEAKDIISTYGIKIKWEKVENGVGEQFINFDPNTQYENLVGDATSVKDYIVNIGRIEPRKNQLNIIEAVEIFRKKHDLDVKLVFVGRKNKIKHPEYTYRFEKKLKSLDWVIYLGEIPWEKMVNVFKYAKVCVSASWFETSGLTSLEALFCETNAVAAGGRAREFLGDFASYCEPNNQDSIVDAVSKEYFAKRPNIRGTYLENYTWENAAKKTFDIYTKLLETKSHDKV